MSANIINKTAIFSALSLLALSGCSEYTMRTDKIYWGAGDAVAANKAIQTIDPWPVASRDRRHITNGERIQLATERYKTNTSIQPQGVGTSSAEFEQSSSSSSSTSQ